jgi:hypothetical protein
MTDKMDPDNDGSNESFLKDTAVDQLDKSLDATQELKDKTTKEIIVRLTRHTKGKTYSSHKREKNRLCNQTLFLAIV